VSPSGRIHRCGQPSHAVATVDGGYYDNSGASPLVELWNRLEPAVAKLNRESEGACVVPVYLQIDNHYKGSPTSPGGRAVPELLVPPLAAIATRDSHENDGRQAAAIEFSQARQFAAFDSDDGPPVPRYAHVYPRAHPGTEAPLGWVLSDASMEDLTAQLRGPGNAAEIAKVRRWLSPGLRCAR
jgi:hypothetical protein